MAKKETYPCFKTLPIAQLKTHPDGVRKSEPESEHLLGKCWDQLGFLRIPTVNIRTGFVLDGDKLVAKLRDRGVEDVPCWVVDVPEELEDLAHLALNNHVGEWQWQPVSLLLKAVLERKQDVGLTGFHESDTGPLLAADWKVPAKGPMDGTDANQIGLL